MIPQIQKMKTITLQLILLLLFVGLVEPATTEKRGNDWMTGFRARMTKLKERLKGLGKKISQQVNEAVAAARANQTEVLIGKSVLYLSETGEVVSVSHGVTGVKKSQEALDLTAPMAKGVCEERRLPSSPLTVCGEDEGCKKLTTSLAVIRACPDLLTVMGPNGNKQMHIGGGVIGAVGGGLGSIGAIIG